jgi:hypothetical protein
MTAEWQPSSACPPSYVWPFIQLIPLLLLRVRVSTNNISFSLSAFLSPPCPSVLPTLLQAPRNLNVSSEAGWKQYLEALKLSNVGQRKDSSPPHGTILPAAPPSIVVLIHYSHLSHENQLALSPSPLLRVVHQSQSHHRCAPAPTCRIG